MKNGCAVLCWIALSTAACGGGSGEAPGSPDEPALQFVQGVDHPYFPLELGTLRIYEGVADGEQRREEVRTLPEQREIDGVLCTAVEQRVFVEGELEEVTTEWYAEDADGNVWKFGEVSFEAIDGVIQPDAADSWISGDGDARAWIAFTSHPAPGQTLVGYTPEGSETFVVNSITQVASVPAGVYANCVEIEEDADDDDPDIILYARGVGRVRETSASTSISLTGVQPE